MLIDANGSQLGNMSLGQALTIAEQVGLDVVEVSPNSSPPVCKLMDFGKYKYQLKKKNKDSRKSQVIIKTKEVKLRPVTDEHDVNVKMEKIRAFLQDGNKVKIGIFLKGREMMYTERAFAMLDRLIKMLADTAVVLETPKHLGKTVYAVLSAKR
ncbi:MAG: translation initiation factor IF-3 [Deltaproteobacteria bacterium]|nr:translation initiation factor IF-3 [Deltaproteobacteria bacterium]